MVHASADSSISNSSASLWPRALLEASALVFLLLLVFSPPWAFIEIHLDLPQLPSIAEVRRGVALLKQVENPFLPITDPTHKILEARLLVPLLGHFLHLPPTAILAGPYLLAIVAAAQMLVYMRRRGVEHFTAVGSVLLLTASGWFFSSTNWLGYYDSALVLGLLAVSHSRPRWALCAACVLTPWIDERFLFGLPLAFATRWLGAVGDFFSTDPEIRRRFRDDALFAASLTVLYLVVRFAFVQSSQSLGFFAYLREQHTLQIGGGRHILGLWEGLRLGWLFIVAGLIFIRPEKLWARYTLWSGMLVTALVSHLIANDLSRSMIVLLPFALEGAIRAGQQWKHAKKSTVVLALPAFAIPAQIVVTDILIPIQNAYKTISVRPKLAKVRTPQYWSGRAEVDFQSGNNSDASVKAQVALRLNPLFSPAHNVLGVIAFKTGDWAQAFASFSRACEISPEEVNFWTNRAHAALRIGDGAAYAESVANARLLGANNPAVLKSLQELESSASSGLNR